MCHTSSFIPKAEVGSSVAEPLKTGVFHVEQSATACRNGQVGGQPGGRPTPPSRGGRCSPSPLKKRPRTTKKDSKDSSGGSSESSEDKLSGFGCWSGSVEELSTTMSSSETLACFITHLPRYWDGVSNVERLLGDAWTTKLGGGGDVRVADGQLLLSDLMREAYWRSYDCHRPLAVILPSMLARESRRNALKVGTAGSAGRHPTTLSQLEWFNGPPECPCLPTASSTTRKRPSAKRSRKASQGKPPSAGSVRKAAGV